MSSDNEELNKILAKSSGSSPRPRSARNKKQEITEGGSEEKNYGKILQWTSPDGDKFVPAGKTIKALEPGVYEVNESPNMGLFFQKIKVNIGNILKFPDSTSEKVVKEIEKFWERKEFFKNRGEKAKITYKRGIILWGPPGGGKTSTIHLVVQDVIKRGGICVVFNHPRLFLGGMRVFRQIHPDVKVVVLMEDLDSIIEMYDESEVLNILDGVNSTEDVVFLATTNYPERLGGRIMNRPSRFDKRIKINYPDAACRKIYLENLLTKDEISKHNIDLDKWVKDTHEFSMAHMKELFTAVVILGDEYEEALKNLTSMKQQVTSDETAPLGFAGNED